MLDVASGNSKLIGNGYGSVWNHSGTRFVVFMDNSLWLYEYPSLKKLKEFQYKIKWRLCSVDWMPSNKYIIAFAYNRSTDQKGIVSAMEAKFIILNSDSLNIIREETMDNMFTKRFVAVNDTMFFCCIQCNICDSGKSTWHILKIDLSKTNVFTHIPAKVFYSVEDIAYIKNLKSIVYPDSKGCMVVSTLNNLDSNNILVPYYITLVGWSEKCVIKK